ncbi:MAG: DUF2975 domain-containing protein [Clostridia bacterium]|nr:DUF2975 domain-containing protein [Clostridia bacterium]MBR4450221.1 DUF2975 domain-containing protein [Clostridia bacterium]
MNSNSIKRINAAGTAGYVISILMIICAIAALVAACIGTAAVVAVLKDDVSITVDSQAKINLGSNSLSKLKHFIGIDGLDDLEDMVNNTAGLDITVNGMNFKDVSAAEKDGRVVINAEGAKNVISLRRVLIFCIIGILYCAACVIALYMVKGLMNLLRKCETPFSDDIIKKLTAFAYSLIPVVILNGVLDGAKPFLNGSAEFAGTNIDLTTLLIAAFIIILIMIFKHGALLQREADETV